MHQQRTLDYWVRFLGIQLTKQDTYHIPLPKCRRSDISSSGLYCLLRYLKVRSTWSHADLMTNHSFPTFSRLQSIHCTAYICYFSNFAKCKPKFDCRSVATFLTIPLHVSRLISTLIHRHLCFNTNIKILKLVLLVISFVTNWDVVISPQKC